MPVTVNGSVLTQQALIGAQPRTLTWTSTVLAAGDLLVVVVAQNGAVEFSSPAAPTGGTGLSWTTILDQQDTATHFSRITAWWSKIPSDQTSTITQVTSGTGSNQHSTLGALYRLSGVDQISPVGSTDGFQGQTDPTGTDLQLTGTKAGSLIFLAASDWSAGIASLTISISNTTSPVTDLNTLESGQFRGISARANQSSSTNQGTLDYSAATGDWAAIIFEIEAAADAGAYVPLNPGWLIQQGLWRPIVGGVEAAGGASFPVDTTDSAGLTDSTAFEYQWIRTDDAGLTDATAFTQALVRTDDSGLTDSATLALVKAVDATDSAGLTDTVAFTEALERTDSAGLTDTALIQQQLVRTDSTGLTDSSTIQVVKAVTADDPVGLTDTTAFREELIRIDSAGLTDTTALTEQLVRTDSVGLTDTSTAGLLRDIVQTDLAGLTDSALFAELLVRTDLVGLTDTAVISGSASPAGVGTMTPVRLSVPTMAAGDDRAATITPGVLTVPAMATGDDRSADMTPATKAVPTTTGG